MSNERVEAGAGAKNTIKEAVQVELRIGQIGYLSHRLHNGLNSKGEKQQPALFRFEAIQHGKGCTHLLFRSVVGHYLRCETDIDFMTGEIIFSSDKNKKPKKRQGTSKPGPATCCVSNKFSRAYNKGKFRVN